MEKEAKSCLKQWLGSIWVWSPFEKGFMMNIFRPYLSQISNELDTHLEKNDPDYILFSKILL